MSLCVNTEESGQFMYLKCSNKKITLINKKKSLLNLFDVL